MAAPATPPLKLPEKYFDAKEHCNVELILKDGSKIRVNSLVLAANSPYLEGLVEEKGLKTIELDGYSMDVVRMFFKALYTGEFEEMSEDIFSEISKLSFTFQVAWMKEVCLAYYSGLLITNQDEFLLELGINAKAYDKEGKYLDILASKKTSQVTNQDIEEAERMLSDMKILSIDHLDFIIRLANRCRRVIVNCTHAHCTNGFNIKNEYGVVLVAQTTKYLASVEKMDAKIRYVLTNLNFKQIVDWYISLQQMYASSTIHRHYNAHDPFKLAASTLFHDLLELKEISNDDLKLTFKQFMSFSN